MQSFQVSSRESGNKLHTFKAWYGHKWARPSKKHLRELMRTIVNDPMEAKRRGAKARERMLQNYSLDVVAGIVLSHLQRIQRAQGSLLSTQAG